jgi:hypothetical protein
MNTAAILDLILSLVSRLQAAAALIQKARAENREITDAELDTLVADDDAARAKLVEAIAAARARESDGSG